MKIPNGWFVLPNGEEIIPGDMCKESYSTDWEMCRGLIGHIVGDSCSCDFICIRRGASPVPEKIWLNPWE